MKKLFSIFILTIIFTTTLFQVSVNASEIEAPLETSELLVINDFEEEEMLANGDLPDEYVVKNTTSRYGQYTKKRLLATKTNYRTYAFVPGFSKNVKRSSFCWGSSKSKVNVSVNFGVSYGYASGSVSIHNGGGNYDCQDVSSSLKSVGTDIKDYTLHTARLYEYKYYDSNNNYLYKVNRSELTRTGSTDYRAVRH